MPPPRGHHFANRLNQNARVCLANCARFSYKRRNGSPSILPFPRGIFCSALALRRGTDHRFKRLVWASLRLSERSRTIEVRVTTLSPQICTKSLTQSCLALSVRSISVQLAKMSGKDPLKTASVAKQTAQRAGRQADKKPADVFRRFVCRCTAVLSTLFRDEFARRACRVNTLCGLSRTPTR